jgi:hypothetical protein
VKIRLPRSAEYVGIREERTDELTPPARGAGSHSERNAGVVGRELDADAFSLELADQRVARDLRNVNASPAMLH